MKPTFTSNEGTNIIIVHWFLDVSEVSVLALGLARYSNTDVGHDFHLLTQYVTTHNEDYTSTRYRLNSNKQTHIYLHEYIYTRISYKVHTLHS